MPQLRADSLPLVPFDGWPPDVLIDALVGRGCSPAQARRGVALMGRAVWRESVPWPDALQRCGRQVRAAMTALCAAPAELAVERDVWSDDGSRKLALSTADGKIIESVMIPAASGTRTTLCVSSQVGCGRRCTFCETGRLGLDRNLWAWEITAQLRLAARLWRIERPLAPPISNVVFMGMGEPLDNLPEVSRAIGCMTHDLAGGLSWRRITVSTVGVARNLAEFFLSTQANLAVSLNAPDDLRRSRWMPINAHCSLDALKSALRDNLPKDRDVLVEYILFAGANDSLADAELLLQWVLGLRTRVNLIPANPGPDPSLRTPSPDRVWAFQKYLLDRGVRAMVRHPHGRDVGGACGQLAGGLREASDRPQVNGPARIRVERPPGPEPAQELP